MSVKAVMQPEYCNADSNTQRTIFKTMYGRIVFLTWNGE